MENGKLKKFFHYPFSILKRVQPLFLRREKAAEPFRGGFW